MLINLSKMYNKILCLVYGLRPMKIMFRPPSPLPVLIPPRGGGLLSMQGGGGARRVNQQVTLLLFCNNGTSETARGITFNFNNYLNLKPLHKKKLNQRFLEWFIGFTEGKGSFIILKNKVYFGITQNLDNIQVLYDIKKQLGFGKVLIRKESSPSAGCFSQSPSLFSLWPRLLRNRASCSILQEVCQTSEPYAQKDASDGARAGAKAIKKKREESLAAAVAAVIRREGVFYVTPGPKGENFHRLITIFNGNLCSKNKKEQFKN